jgi:DNA-binding CsgD family transcriptional regulator
VTAAVARHFARAVPHQPQRAIDVGALLASHPCFAGLTGREREVCLRILSGQSSEAISSELSISIHSTLTYRRRAYERLGISSQNELFGLVLKHLTAAGLAPAPGLN